MGRIKKPHWSPVAYSLLNGKHRTGLYMRSTVFTVFLVFEKSKKKNFVDKNLPCLWKIFSVYEMSYLWNVLSMKFPIYEMSVYEMSVYEMSVYEMSFYEMFYLWNVVSKKCLSMKCPSMKCHNARFTPSGCKDKGLENLSLWLRLNSFVLNVNKKLKIYDVFFILWNVLSMKYILMILVESLTLKIRNIF